MFKEVLGWAKTIAFALVVAAAISLVARPSLVIGNSMKPTLHNYNLLLLERVSVLTSLPNRGDIILFKSRIQLNRWMKKNLIKRVIGIEGDRVRISAGNVYINESIIEEIYILPLTIGDVDVVVPEGSVYVLGDNRQASTDSRFEIVGFVNKKQILGKAYIRLFPFNQMEIF